MTTGLPSYASPWLHDLARVLARWIYRPAFRLRVHGTERVPRTGPVVVVANHISMIEPQLIFGILPRRSVFLVKRQLFHGSLGWALDRIGQLPVRRGDPDRASLLEAVRVLRGGGVVGVFPEGTRGDGDVENAEQGAAWLVRSSGAVVVPVAVRGTKPPADGRIRLRPRVDMLIGEPFQLVVPRGRQGLVDATEELRKELADVVRALDTWREAHGMERNEG
ncbi:lysophospholipid acyltransferase family protein [Haloechinothrix sp. LS1_15]|uniref:lysophospholipid acyltransferase family protein n=1 Tax=Haloechinothrix sp. LS1_15 TaxID=2652248 RepID=UPI002945AAE0|nr:lysophospholipid acyltransferase family protein [Haloechinothrix sp. LS1_15]MDV6013421.1 1-acyl-sn-glycerol-3-phosphate acyltransferase [Haloechinothrix sp. LS1_15]